ncbi:protein kinase domain-containing protein [Aquisphaera insulae]|uniref:protein kinase domain-containing protein n=1 Tax=Aquisphaera insulae TaxID=2712864 RepID=UPI0013ECE137|nr:protein kinase [Aquisphaera insulae]
MPRPDDSPAPRSSEPRSSAREARVEALLQDLRRRWRAGTPRRVEDYLDADPSLAGDEALLLELIRGEFLALRERGEATDPASFAARFPSLATEILARCEAGTWPGDGPGWLPPTDPFSDTAAVPQESTEATGSGESSLGVKADAAGPRPVDRVDAPLDESDFELEGLLGEGGMGEVHTAFQKSLRRRVALKRIHRDALASPGRVRRFVAEARALARLRHPRVVGVHGIGRAADGCYFLVMDLVPGGKTLADLVKDGPAEPERAAALVAGIAETIEHAHGRGVVHRDLKPSNVLLDGDGEPHITDFGLAKVFDEADPDQPLTSADHILGTPHYMSPEQANPHRGPITPRTDVYGLGGILFALLTGKPPIAGDSLTHVLTQLISDAPVRSPGALRADIPPGLERICRRCLSKEPADRYASARDVADALRSWLASPGDSGSERKPHGTGRRGWTADRSLKQGNRPQREDLSWRAPMPTRTGAGSAVLLRRAAAAGAVLAVLLLAGVPLLFRNRPRDQAPPLPPSVPSTEVLVASPEPPPLLPAAPVQIAVQVAPAVIDRMKADPGSLAIVLDWSGSMIQRDRKGTRASQVREALGRVLATGVSEGTTVSVWMFGQVPEGTTPLKSDPVVLRPELTITRIYSPTRWRSSESERLLAALDRHSPSLETPLAEAMWRAAESDLKAVAGPRKLLVLTDGADTRLKASTGLDVGEFLRSRFKDLGIQIHVIFFDAGDGAQSEREQVRNDFQAPLAALDPPGTFLAPEDLGTLITDLRTVVSAGPVCELLGPDGVPVDEGIITWTTPGEKERPWSRKLRPGTYRLRVLGSSGSAAERDIEIEPDSRVRIRILPSGDRAIEIRVETEPLPAEASR